MTNNSNSNMNNNYIQEHFDEIYNSQDYLGSQAEYNEEQRIEAFRNYLEEMGYYDEDDQEEIIDYFSEQLGIRDGLNSTYRFPSIEEIKDFTGE